MLTELIDGLKSKTKIQDKNPRQKSKNNFKKEKNEK